MLWKILNLVQTNSVAYFCPLSHTERSWSWSVSWKVTCKSRLFLAMGDSLICTEQIILLPLDEMKWSASCKLMSLVFVSDRIWPLMHFGMTLHMQLPVSLIYLLCGYWIASWHLERGIIQKSIAGFQCHAIQNRSKSKSKPFDRLSPESGKWKEVNIQTPRQDLGRRNNSYTR